VVSYIGRFAPAVAVPLASSKGGEPATELTSSRSNTTNGDATRLNPLERRQSKEGGLQLHKKVACRAVRGWT
jgi:hypothetical protein